MSTPPAGARPPAREAKRIPSRMKRIWLITYEYPPIGGGTGKVVRNTARQLARLGYDVLVLTARCRGLREEEADPDGFRVHRIPVLRKRPNQANAIEVMSFAASGLWRLGELARLPRPDLTIGYFTLPSSAVCWALRRRLGVPYITLLLGQDVPGHPEAKAWMHALARPAVRAIWAGSARLVANSRGLAAQAELARPPRPVDVAVNGVDLEIYRPAGALDASSEGLRAAARAGRGGAGRGFRVAYIGRLTRQKGVRELLAAFASFLASRAPGAPAAELVIAGAGPDEAFLKQRARELGLADAVRFLGRIEEPAVVATLRSADLFVNPSHGEGLPAAVLEAMAVGVATLASDIAPHREILEGGFGLLFPTGDAAALAARLVEAENSPELRAGLAWAARRHVLENYGWDRAVARLVELFPPDLRPDPAAISPSGTATK